MDAAAHVWFDLARHPAQLADWLTMAKPNHSKSEIEAALLACEKLLRDAIKLYEDSSPNSWLNAGVAVRKALETNPGFYELAEKDASRFVGFVLR